MNDNGIQGSDGAETVAKVLRLTRQAALAWEATADPDTLIAPFKGEYVFQLSRFENPDSHTAVGYGLSVVKEHRAVMSFSSGLCSTTLDMFALGERSSPYQHFEELWKRASLCVNQVPDEFERVNKLLDSELVEASH